MNQSKTNRAYKNLKIAFELYELAYSVKKQTIKKKFPDKTKEEIHKLTVELIHKGLK